ncbi:protein FAR1-RELATED SEQUENCE 5-like [Silene latifolia]|uniref:protein FAR1-RELATED SEQUENCE 5-like n=1 Tax=Silene latifolia TaxID=37657 RepID=UPI003D78A932
MYAKRKQWVMAHCRDLEMGGVMRTTQRSESENSFFKRFESKSRTLVEFSLRFDSAMDQQRHAQKKLDNDNKHTSPQMSTHLAIEVHGVQLYSHKVFEEFKEEVKYSIDTFTFKATRSCRMLGRKDIICRHVIWIYSSNGLKTIPDECVVNTWCKDAVRSKMFDCNGEAAKDVDIIDGKQIAMSVMWSKVHQTVGMLMGKCKVDVDNFSNLIREFKEKLSPLGSPLNKQQQLE